MKFNFDIEMSSNFSSHNGIVFLNGSNPGKFSRQNYENLCYLLDTVGKLSSEVREKIFNILYFNKIKTNFLFYKIYITNSHKI